jgi:hypothetical protein
MARVNLAAKKEQAGRKAGRGIARKSAQGWGRGRHQHVPSAATAAVWSEPQDTETITSDSMPPTIRGTRELVVAIPSPSCPSFPAPQVYNVPCRLMQIQRQTSEIVVRE